MVQYTARLQKPFQYLLPSVVLRMDKQYTVKNLITYFICLCYSNWKWITISQDRQNLQCFPRYDQSVPTIWSQTVSIDLHRSWVQTRFAQAPFNTSSAVFPSEYWNINLKTKRNAPKPQDLPPHTHTHTLPKPKSAQFKSGSIHFLNCCTPWQYSFPCNQSTFHLWH